MTASNEPTPEGYSRHVITGVIHFGDSLAIKYAGKIFGGVMLAELPPGVAETIKPGTEIIIRYHSAETGDAGAVAHMLVPNPADEGWAEIYEDL